MAVRIPSSGLTVPAIVIVLLAALVTLGPQLVRGRCRKS